MPERTLPDGSILYFDEGPKINPGHVLDRVLEASTADSPELIRLENSIKKLVTELVNNLLVLREPKFDTTRNEHLERLIVKFERKARRTIQIYVLTRKKHSFSLSIRRKNIESFGQESLGAYFLYAFLLFHKRIKEIDPVEREILNTLKQYIKQRWPKKFAAIEQY